MNLTFYTKATCVGLLLLFLFGGSFSLYAQNRLITLKVNEANVDDVLSKIRTDFSYKLLFNHEEAKAAGKVTLDLKNVSIETALNEIFKSNNLAFKKENDVYVIVSKEALAKGNTQKNVNQATLSGQNTLTVSGTVLDETGTPLPGAVVNVEGSHRKSVITDIDGKFELTDIPSNANLVFSFLGYETLEYTLGGKTTLEIELKPAASQLDEVVVVGYGKTSTRLNTGSISSITGKIISEQPVAEPLAALQGRIPGMFISSSNGLPGGGYTVQIRGLNSINSGNNPLFIVDGVPYSSESLNQFSGANGKQNPLSSINPADIDRIDVLKDADATAIYGSRGANGVVLISTKRGKSGKTKVDFDIYTGISQVAHKVAMLNAYQYYDLRNEAFTNDGVVPDDTNAPDLITWDKNKTTDWQDYLIGKNASLTEARLAFSGGNEQTSFLLSGTYRYETTVFPGSMDYGRGATLLNVNHHSKDNKFNLTASASYSSDNNNSGPTDLTQYYNLPPNYPLYNADGSLYWFGNIQNPAAFLSRKYNSKTNSLIGNTVLSYMILNGLEKQ